MHEGNNKPTECMANIADSDLIIHNPHFFMTFPKSPVFAELKGIGVITNRKIIKAIKRKSDLVLARTESHLCFGTSVEMFLSSGRETRNSCPASAGILFVHC